MNSNKTTDHEEILEITAWRKWLVQWDVTHFAIALATSAFATMCKVVCSHFTKLFIPRLFSIALWFEALVALLIVLVLYIARIVLWPGSILFDFRNPKMVSFFFVPVIVGCLLTLGAPPFVMNYNAHRLAFFILGTYQVSLGMYLSGEWLFGSALINVAHPVVFMQVIGYFLLGSLASKLLYVELAIASISIGSLFWILIFVTNFQHTSIGLTRRSEKPQPTFFLFIAAPAQAAIALFLLGIVIEGGSEIRSSTGLLQVQWNANWNILAKGALYIDLFIYALIFRLLPTFWTQEFAITWWAYIFPLSAAASAAVLRASSVSHSVFWAVLSGILVYIASVAMMIVFIATIWGLYGRMLPRNEGAVTAYCEHVVGSSKLYLKNENGMSSADESEMSV